MYALIIRRRKVGLHCVGCNWSKRSSHRMRTVKEQQGDEPEQRRLTSSADRESSLPTYPAIPSAVRQPYPGRRKPFSSPNSTAPHHVSLSQFSPNPVPSLRSGSIMREDVVFICLSLIWRVIRSSKISKSREYSDFWILCVGLQCGAVLNV